MTAAARKGSGRARAEPGCSSSARNVMRSLVWDWPRAEGLVLLLLPGREHRAASSASAVPVP
jgi:hypothetical protein